MRIETFAAKHLQQLQQLKQLAEQVLRQPDHAASEKQPQPAVQGKSKRPADVSLERRIAATKQKLLTDIWKLAELDKGTLLTRSAVAEAFAQKRADLQTLSQQLTAEGNEYADEFSQNVAAFRDLFLQDAGNIEDARQTHAEDTAQIGRHVAQNAADNQNLAELQADFVEDSHNIQTFQANARTDKNNLDSFQETFVKDAHNLAELQADFVDDTHNRAALRSDFEEDRGNLQSAQQQFSSQRGELHALKQNFAEDVANLNAFQANYAADKQTLRQFSDQGAGAVVEQPPFREPFDAEVEQLTRLQKPADSSTTELQGFRKQSQIVDAKPVRPVATPTSRVPTTNVTEAVEHQSPPASQPPATVSRAVSAPAAKAVPPDSGTQRRAARPANTIGGAEQSKSGRGRATVVDQTQASAAEPMPQEPASPFFQTVADISRDSRPPTAFRQVAPARDAARDPRQHPPADLFQAVGLVAQATFDNASQDSATAPLRDSFVASFLNAGLQFGSSQLALKSKEERPAEPDNKEQSDDDFTPSDPLVAEWLSPPPRQDN